MLRPLLSALLLLPSIAIAQSAVPQNVQQPKGVTPPQNAAPANGQQPQNVAPVQNAQQPQAVQQQPQAGQQPQAAQQPQAGQQPQVQQPQAGQQPANGQQQQQPPANAQAPAPGGGGDGYQGYNVTASGPPGSAVYSTPNKEIGNSDENATFALPIVPDIFLNASAHVGEISLVVENITAKVNVEAQVLKLLNFNAGVTASIDRVRLLIQGVEARVTLEARLENVVAMVNDVLHAIDLKPILAHLSKDVNHIVNNAVNTLAAPVDPGTHSRLSLHVLKRRSDGSDALEHGILYSINDYSGNAHTNRVLAQDGSLVDVFIDNQGHEHGYTVVGYYQKDMKYTGRTHNTTLNGNEVREVEYMYTPFMGIEAICGIYLDQYGHVSGTRVLAEIEGGGSSTIF